MRGRRAYSPRFGQGNPNFALSPPLC
jgi:hypothetical protein